MSIIPVKLFANPTELNCPHCNKNLLDNTEMAIVVLIEENDKIIDIYACCKGQCDEILKKKYPNTTDGWKEFSDFLNPYLYLKHIMAVLNNMQEGKITGESAIKNYKNIIIAAAPYVLRQPTDGEKEDFNFDNSLPF